MCESVSAHVSLAFIFPVINIASVVINELLCAESEISCDLVANRSVNRFSKLILRMAQMPLNFHQVIQFRFRDSRNIRAFQWFSVPYILILFSHLRIETLNVSTQHFLFLIKLSFRGKNGANSIC